MSLRKRGFIYAVWLSCVVPIWAWTRASIENIVLRTTYLETSWEPLRLARDSFKSALALYQRARCHVALNNMQEALKDLNKVIEIASTDKVALADRECLQALKLASGRDG